MTQRKMTAQNRVRERRALEELNVFSRLPAVYSASRAQGQRFLKLGGGLSIVEWRTLWDLSEAGPMTIRELAALQRTDHSLLSRALPAMREKGYVSMVQDEADKRQTLVAIAPKGKTAYEKAAPIMARRRAALRETMSEDELRMLISLLSKLEDFLHIPVEKILELEPTE